MAARPARPSLAAWSLFAVTWHFSVWLGWGLVLLAAVLSQPVIGEMPAAFWVIAALVLLGELRPVRTAGSYDPQGVVTSTACRASVWRAACQRRIPSDPVSLNTISSNRDPSASRHRMLSKMPGRFFFMWIGVV